MYKGHEIKHVEPESIAEELGVEAGDYLLEINGKQIEDALDLRYFETEEDIVVLIYKTSEEEEWELEIEKEADEDLGFVFEDNLLDSYHSCSNKCVFCFIDQLPSGLRETLYFKDDDARLSFLQGNYITMTNIKEKEIDRIIEYRMNPINISIHTMDMELRKQMLHNKFASRIIPYMDKLYKAEIIMNGQIVLCRGINDKEHLRYTLEQLLAYHPYMQSVSIVPVGLTKYRQHLKNLDPFDKEAAKEVIDLVKEFQEKSKAKGGNHFIHAGDEFYFLANEEVPLEETYDGYLQYENGVGMTRLLIDEVTKLIEDMTKEEAVALYKNVTSHNVSKGTIITGKMIEPVLQELRQKALKKLEEISGLDFTVLDEKRKIKYIENEFFGPNITVTGLITGQDIITQCKKADIGETIYIVTDMLKHDEDIFLDDVHIHDIEKEINVKVDKVSLSSAEFFKLLTAQR